MPTKRHTARFPMMDISGKSISNACAREGWNDDNDSSNHTVTARGYLRGGLEGHFSGSAMRAGTPLSDRGAHSDTARNSMTSTRDEPSASPMGYPTAGMNTQQMTHEENRHVATVIGSPRGGGFEDSFRPHLVLARQVTWEATDSTADSESCSPIQVKTSFSTPRGRVRLLRRIHTFVNPQPTVSISTNVRTDLLRKPVPDTGTPLPSPPRSPSVATPGAGRGAVFPPFPVADSGPERPARLSLHEVIGAVCNTITILLDVADVIRLAMTSRSMYDAIMNSSHSEHGIDGSFADGQLSPTRFTRQTLSFYGISSRGDVESTAEASSRVECGHLEVGTWWNTLTESTERELMNFLARCRLRSISVADDFYKCQCVSCVPEEDPGDPRPPSTTRSDQDTLQRSPISPSAGPELPRLPSLALRGRHPSLAPQPRTPPSPYVLREAATSLDALSGSPTFVRSSTGNGDEEIERGQHLSSSFPSRLQSYNRCVSAASPNATHDLLPRDGSCLLSSDSGIPMPLRSRPLSASPPRRDFDTQATPAGSYSSRTLRRLQRLAPHQAPLMTPTPPSGGNVADRPSGAASPSHGSPVRERLRRLRPQPPRGSHSLVEESEDVDEITDILVSPNARLQPLPETEQSAALERREEPQGFTTQQRHGITRFFWVLRVMLLNRKSLEKVNFGSMPKEVATIFDTKTALPAFPASLQAVASTVEFSNLRRLRFGPMIETRFIVPLLDFCRYPRLEEVEMLGMPLFYEMRESQIGKEPTMIFAPQQLFDPPGVAEDGSALPSWLPAIYNGSIDENCQLQGYGVYVSREYRYEGFFKDGRNEGFGCMTSRCGERYEGGWHHGRRQGQGRVFQSDGKLLEGQWLDDVLHGRGTMQLCDGLHYEGDWWQGALHGWGVLARNGFLLAVGQFIQGRPSGWMICRHPGDPSTSPETQSKPSPPAPIKISEATPTLGVQNCNTFLDPPSQLQGLTNTHPQWVTALVKRTSGPLTRKFTPSFEEFSTEFTAQMTFEMDSISDRPTAKVLQDVFAQCGSSVETISKGEAVWNRLLTCGKWLTAWRVDIPDTLEQEYESWLRQLDKPVAPEELLLLDTSLLQQKAGLKLRPQRPPIYDLPQPPGWMKDLIATMDIS